MNKITLLTKTERKLVNNYRNLVYKDTLSKLVFIIGIFATRERKINFKELGNSEIEIGGTKYLNDLKLVGRKKILNGIFTLKKKFSTVNDIEYSRINRKTSYKKSFQVLTSSSSDLITLYNHLDSLLFKKLTSRELKKALRQLDGKFKSMQDKEILGFIFDYPYFFHQAGTNENYFGIELAKALDTNVCVYCNREYISTITNVNGKKIISPAFDHFLSQKEFPYLAISLFNLIPSCYSCNSQLKYEEEFNLSQYLYPYEACYEGLALFSASLKKSLLAKCIPSEIININDIEISLESKTIKKDIRIFGNPSLPINKIKGNLNVFQTNYIYNTIHKDSVHEIITKFRVHSKKDIESLRTSYSFIKSESDVYNFYFHNYLNENDFNKRPLSRMTRDIAKQLEKIYGINF